MKKSILVFKQNKKKKEPITWITAYSYPMAKAAEAAEIDMILVGDSGGMVELGYQTTNPVTMDEMIQLAKAARKGAPNTFIVGDMPQGSYEVSDEEAVKNAMRFIKEAGCDAIKLEGAKRMLSRIKAISQSGIIVVAHLGLTPQSTSSFGGYRVQGKTIESFEETIEDSKDVQDAGASLLLLEAMPAESAEQVSKQLSIPVLGIGTGQKVDGQLIIMHDLLGFYPDFRPWFAKCYIPQVIHKYQEQVLSQPNIKKYGIDTRADGLNFIVTLAIKEYVNEVKSGIFPNVDYNYPIKEEELIQLKKSKFWI
uniref:3-methyl-2-oxobutanoate hydroxymethyltransferase n=1 Tax=Algoriphagus sp. TaxID=1872435 RepID=UPI004047EB05